MSQKMVLLIHFLLVSVGAECLYCSKAEFLNRCPPSKGALDPIGLVMFLFYASTKFRFYSRTATDLMLKVTCVVLFLPQGRKSQNVWEMCSSSAHTYNVSGELRYDCGSHIIQSHYEKSKKLFSVYVRFSKIKILFFIDVGLS
jgi:hypothetical protein